ncbi:MerR family transcriptional regulator [Companilactobacillus kimchiensis]|uniref:Transcriptional regulator n=1 Tax=Companilactobacillus kimchiensis TaxID=993692 RepID=A0A0R2LAV3_9LACO|nr:MerR family transcriptional regulator [Companilactobacillus kimchiensis]KRN98963.1 transcriptional regulator [Companilactobacillus kimchiensis]
MSEYTTGELAKLTNISVRTIQYYDKKDLLKPNRLLDSDRRIYNDADVSRLKLILLLKNLGLPLSAIAEILDSENSMTVLNLLLEQQERALKTQIEVSKNKLKLVEEIKRNLPQIDQVSIKSIADIDKIMNNKKSLRKVHIHMLLWGIPIDLIEIGTLTWGIIKSDWTPFIIGMIIVAIGATLLTKYYFQNTNYICSNCNAEFKPKFWAAFFGVHNSKARKLVCPNCGKKDYCVEVYDEKRSIKSA